MSAIIGLLLFLALTGCLIYKVTGLMWEARS